MHLEPRDAESHHDVRHSVRLREEVGDLAAGLDIPVRHAAVTHLLLRVAGELPALFHLALSHGLHRLERERRGDADGDEVYHNIVAAAHRLVDRRGAGGDKVADVARPHVRAVTEAGKADERVELLGLGIDKHLAGEGCAELRHADGARLSDDLVIVRQTERRGRGEDGHGLGVGEGYFLRVHPFAQLLGEVLHHADHRRVIMPQLVELEEVRLHAVVFKMRCDNIAVGVVCRVLHRAEVRDILVLRHNDEPAGVLPRCALYAHKPLREAVLLRLAGLYAALLEVLFHVAVGGLFRERADRPGAENMVGAEKRLGVLVRLCLILSGEIEVYIRGLFVAGEAEERLKRDVEPIAAHTRAALGAVLFRHIRAAAVAAVEDELAVAALGADIVRREGVDLSDAGHVRHDRRADRPTRADEVAVFERVFNELLRGHIYNVVVMVEYGVELNIHALLHERGRIFAVDAVHLVVHQRFQLLGGVLDLRGEEVLGQKLYLLHLIGDGAGVCDDDLLRRLLAEVHELLHHLVRCAEEDGAAAVRVGEFLRRLKYLAVLLVLRVHEVHVGRGNDGLIELSAEV